VKSNATLLEVSKRRRAKKEEKSSLEEEEKFCYENRKFAKKIAKLGSERESAAHLKIQ
jgi:hypothetical protein